ncbi:dimethylamine monooxygenase subunit DmmA family protein [Stutzerimonas tarimensis]|uniref:Dimethylamine monooxygenase subunit DmmA family protein n=1 Tax=Stutzerimonas tarimensis TaxID=1507735 RepID=A0ABV7TDJ8_9GAMM
MADTIFSTPVYPAEAARVAASRRILVTQDNGLPGAERLLTQFKDQGGPLLVLSPRSVGQRFEEMLGESLGKAQVGTRLYVCGDEAFLWQVRALARQAGLLDEEIEMFRSGARRRLYCVHCSTLQDIGEVDSSVCTGCGVRLMVRNHFSRRLGAYAGVCLDPNDPRGEGCA